MIQAAKAHFLNRVNKLVPPRPFGREEADGVKDLGATYETYVRLRKSGRDTIWTFVARNLARPLSLSFAGGWANVVVGNPPWVAFRHMTPELQKRFKELAKAAGVFVGGKFATQNDLCALFTVRAASLYLRAGGRLAFVLPMAVLSRGQFEPLRSGSYLTGARAMGRSVGDERRRAAVVSGAVLRRCSAGGARHRGRLPEEVRVYSGPLPMRDAPEEVFDRLVAEGKFTITEKAPRPTEGVFTGGSAYRSSFRQGATLVPRMLCFVEKQARPDGSAMILPRPTSSAAVQVRKRNPGRICRGSRTRWRRSICAPSCSAKAFSPIASGVPSRR